MVLFMYLQKARDPWEVLVVPVISSRLTAFLAVRFARCKKVLKEPPVLQGRLKSAEKARGAPRGPSGQAGLIQAACWVDRCNKQVAGVEAFKPQQPV